jgi:beta-lactamase class A
MNRVIVALLLLTMAACGRLTPPAREQAASPTPPVPPADVQVAVSTLAGGFRGDAGVAVMDVKEGWIAAFNGERWFPQQSVSKVWVALATLDAVDQGKANLDDPVIVRHEDLSVFAQPMEREVGAAAYQTTVGDLLRRAIDVSDNAADDILMARLGGAQSVEHVLARKRIVGIRIGADQKDLQSKIAGMTWRPQYIGPAFKTARAQVPPEVRDASLAAYLADPPDGASPIATVRALSALARGELLSERSTAAMLTLLGGTRTGPMRLRAGLDPDWFIGHKTGTGPDWRGASVGINDIALVTAPDGHEYAIAVFIARTSASIPERLAFMQAVSRAVVSHWNAQHPDLAGSAAPATPSATAQTDS